MAYSKLSRAFFIFVIYLPVLAGTDVRKCWIKNIIGVVKVRKAQSIEWSDARISMILRQKDAIRTFIESEAELETSEGTVIKISENSTLELSTLSQNKEEPNTKIKILKGNIYANVKKLVNTKAEFDFETPTATASIRGTKVEFDVKDTSTQIKVHEGLVYVVPKGAKVGVEVKENQMATVVRGQKTVTIQEVKSKDTLPSNNKIEKKLESEADSVVPTIDTSKVPIDTINTGLPRQEIKDSATGAAVSRQKFMDEHTKAMPLELIVFSPKQGEEFVLGNSVTVSGKVSPVEAEVMVNDRQVKTVDGGFKIDIPSPEAAGEFTVTIEAIHDKKGKSNVIRVKFKAPTLNMSVTSPHAGQNFNTTKIPVKGVVSVGAEVTAGGIKMAVSKDGTFSGIVPIPDEEGEYNIEIEAELFGVVKRESRKIIYRPELQLTVTYPKEHQEHTTVIIGIKGNVIPPNASVTANGTKMVVNRGGEFAGNIRIPAEEGEHEIEFEAATDGQSVKQTRVVRYKSPADPFAPSIQPSSMPSQSTHGRLAFTVIDRTPNEQVTFYREIDGTVESETGAANTVFYLELEEGIHEYAVYATDAKQNRSAVVRGRIIYLNRMPTIRMRNPIENFSVLTIPPPGPKTHPTAEILPEKTIEFRVENLPDNNLKLVKEVSVLNKTAGISRTVREPVDIDFEIDIPIKRSSDNIIEIQLRDINDRIVRQTLTIRAQ